MWDDLHLFRESVSHKLDQVQLIHTGGRVKSLKGSLIRSDLPNSFVGEIVLIETNQKKKVHLIGEVIAFEGNEALIVCLEDVLGVTHGARVTSTGRSHAICVNDTILGRILDGFGRDIEQGLSLDSGVLDLSGLGESVIKEGPSPTDRPPISSPMKTKIACIDVMNTFGSGQRIGIFAPPGCGKSTLMAQIARGADVDRVVFGLVGERGREVREFYENELDEATRTRSVVVCATSDKSALERVRAAFTATTIAEAYRNQGLRVLLLIDSVTRLARAQREIGMAAGEPTTRDALTPSVYQLLPRLIERSGRTQVGDITAVYTVLMEKKSISEDAVASECKSLLDAHLILSQEMANKGQYPAVDIIQSLSRVQSNVVDEGHLAVCRTVRRIYERYQKVELLLQLDEYKKGSDAETDYAIERISPIASLFAQARREIRTLDEDLNRLREILE